MIFETKKLTIETLSEYLSVVRKQNGFSIAEVCLETEICEKYLLALEAGKYQDLPPDVYVLGFLKKLSLIYHVSETDLVNQFKKERSIVLHSQQKTTKQSRLRTWVNNLVLTPKLISLGTICLLVFFVLGYVATSVAAIDKTPSLEIFEPQDGNMINGTTVFVSGKTDPGNTITVNSQSLFVDGEGKFQTTLGVIPGQKELVLRAINKFGRDNSTKLTLIVDNPVGKNQSSNKEEKSMVLELKFKKPASYIAVVDGAAGTKQLAAINDSQKLTGKEKITIQADDAGAIEAVFNGKAIGVLGRSGEPLTVDFSAKDSEVVKSSSADQK